ncbi:MAG: hypothetical protein P8M17_13005 [Saprospiraceae bacterium]|nr:hypothetical protein [Saprospiraceae bacterium]
MSNTLSKRISFYCLIILFIGNPFSELNAQVQANGYGFNYFPRQWFADNDNGAGYSFYAAVWPIMEKYPDFKTFN